LQATVSNQDRSEQLLLPATPQRTAIDFPTAFSISVPSSRTGQVDIAILGLNSSGAPVAHGAAFATLQADTFVKATVDLEPGAPACATGGSCADAGPEVGAPADSREADRLDTGAVVPDVPVAFDGPGPDTAASADLASSEISPCPSGEIRVHIRDVWSIVADPPSMRTMTSPPLEVQVIDSSVWAVYGARKDSGSAGCTYYSACLPTSISKIMVKPVGPDACPMGNQSGSFDLSSFKDATDVWIEHLGKDDTTIANDFSSATVGANAFSLTSDPRQLTHPACAIGVPPSATVPDGYTKIHFRWPWNDPADPKTPFPGSACPLDFATKMGFTVPPYPSSLKVTGLACEMSALLEFQDGNCPWYYLLIPNSAWPTTGAAKTIGFRYPEESKGLYTSGIALPARAANEYWIAYSGPPDNTSASATKCADYSLKASSYTIDASGNPVPSYPGCGSAAAGGAMASGGAVGTGGAGGTGGVAGPGTGGASGTGGRAGTGGNVGNGGRVGTGGAVGGVGGVAGPGTGGASGTGGSTGSGGVPGTGGSTSVACRPACSADQDCIGGSCIAIPLGGMTCATTQDCPSYATCCDGSNETCDGTRLPPGDGTYFDSLGNSQYVVSDDKLTVTDTITGLVWQRDGSGMRDGCSGSGKLTCTWDEANAYCALLTWGGVSGWRLPAVMELSTIVDFTRTNPTIDLSAFPNTPGDYFWASSPCTGSANCAWSVYFIFGYSTGYGVGNYGRVRCVR
jgi:hypothetical protein